MSNWIKFDANKPETWKRSTEILVKLSSGETWLGEIPHSGQVFVAKGSDGELILTEEITHYMVPDTPSELITAASTPPLWWCPHCLELISVTQVTDDGTHDLCGNGIEVGSFIRSDMLSVPRLLDTADSLWFKWLLVDAQSESMNGPDVWQEIITRFETKEQSE